MLDTNAVSAMMRDPRGSVGTRIRQVGTDKICCSVVVASELRFGAAIHASGIWIKRVEEALSALKVLPLEQPVDVHYGQIRAQLKMAGEMIGANDLFIAAHALYEDLTLVTANEREFQRVDGLKVENWEASDG
jgi:tRNA(fMet)-specific endonuclease VapC